MALNYHEIFILNCFSSTLTKDEKESKELSEIIKELKNEDKKNAQELVFEKLKKLGQDAQSPSFQNAKILLGFCYYYGVGVKCDFKQAFDILNAIKDKDNMYAEYLLGNIYERGTLDIKRNLEQAVICYQKSAKSGFACAQYTLGRLYIHGVGVVQSDEKALDYFHKAAYQKYSYANFYLGWMYENGRGCFRDEKQSAEWYQKFSKEYTETFIDSVTDVSILYLLGKRFEDGINILNSSKNQKLSVRCYQNAKTIANCDKEEIIGKYYLALIYQLRKDELWLFDLHDWELNKNPELADAADLYQQAAEHGHVDSLLALGEMHTGGDLSGQRRDKVLSYLLNPSKHLTRIAEQGNAKACYILGILYESKNDSEETQIKALQWYHWAAEQGNAKAQIALAWFYRRKTIKSKPCDDKELQETLTQFSNQNIHDRLNLSNRQITAVGVKRIADFLNKNPKTPRVIDLCGNPLYDKGANILASNLSYAKDTSVVGLLLGNCEIGDEGAESLAQMLQSNKTLQCLALWGNNITHKGEDLLLKAISKNAGSLKCLWLEGNQVSEPKSFQEKYDFKIRLLNKALQTFLDSNKVWAENYAKEFESSYEKLKTEIREQWLFRSDEARIYGLIINKILSCAEFMLPKNVIPYLYYLYFKFPEFWSSEQLVQFSDLFVRRFTESFGEDVNDGDLEWALTYSLKALEKTENQDRIKARIECLEKLIKISNEMNLILKEKIESLKEFTEVIEKIIIQFENLNKFQFPKEFLELQARFTKSLSKDFEKKLITFIKNIDKKGDAQWMSEISFVLHKFHENKRFIFSGRFCSDLADIHKNPVSLVPNYQESLKWYRRASDLDEWTASGYIKLIEKELKQKEEKQKQEEESLKHSETIRNLMQTYKAARETLYHCTREEVLTFPGGAFAFSKKHMEMLNESYRSLQSICSHSEIRSLEDYNLTDILIRLSMMVPEQGIDLFESWIKIVGFDITDMNLYFRLGILYEEEMDLLKRNNKAEQADTCRLSAESWYRKALTCRHPDAQSALMLLHFKSLNNAGIANVLGSSEGGEFLKALNGNFAKLHSNWETSNKLGEQQNKLSERQLSLEQESIEVRREDIKAQKEDTKSRQEQTEVLRDQIKISKDIQTSFLKLAQEFHSQWEKNREFLIKEERDKPNPFVTQHLTLISEKINVLEKQFELLDQKQKEEAQKLLQIMKSEWYSSQEQERIRKEVFSKAIQEISAVPSAHAFYKTLMLRLHAFFHSLQSLASGRIQRNEVSYKDKAAKILDTLGFIIPVSKPLTSLASGKLKSSEDAVVNSLAATVNELVMFGIGSEKLNNFMTEIALSFTRKYGDQILCLTPNGATALGNAVFECIEECIRKTELEALSNPKTYLDFVSSANIPDLKKMFFWSKKVEKSVEKDKAWSCAGILLRTGVKVLATGNTNNADQSPSSFCFYYKPQTQEKDRTATHKTRKYGFRLEDPAAPFGYLPLDSSLVPAQVGRPLLFSFKIQSQVLGSIQSQSSLTIPSRSQTIVVKGSKV